MTCPFTKLMNYLEVRRRRNQTRVELSRMTDRELWDIGLNRYDIERVVREEYVN